MKRQTRLKGLPQGVQIITVTAGDYKGPSVAIWFDKDWLYVSTDEYEGTAMMNIEALRPLRRALGKIAAHLKLESWTDLTSNTPIKIEAEP